MLIRKKKFKMLVEKKVYILHFKTFFNIELNNQYRSSTVKSGSAGFGKEETTPESVGEET